MTICLFQEYLFSAQHIFQHSNVSYMKNERNNTLKVVIDRFEFRFNKCLKNYIQRWCFTVTKNKCFFFFKLMIKIFVELVFTDHNQKNKKNNKIIRNLNKKYTTHRRNNNLCLGRNLLIYNIYTGRNPGMYKIYPGRSLHKYLKWDAILIEKMIYFFIVLHDRLLWHLELHNKDKLLHFNIPY